MFDLHVIQQNLGQSLLLRGHALHTVNFQDNSSVSIVVKPDCFTEKLALCIVRRKEAIFRILVSCVACKSKEYKL